MHRRVGGGGGANPVAPPRAQPHTAARSNGATAAPSVGPRHPSLCVTAGVGAGMAKALHPPRHAAAGVGAAAAATGAAPPGCRLRRLHHHSMHGQDGRAGAARPRSCGRCCGAGGRCCNTVSAAAAASGGATRGGTWGAGIARCARRQGLGEGWGGLLGDTRTHTAAENTRTAHTHTKQRQPLCFESNSRVNPSMH
jgi:hypothetical protein